MNRILLPGGWKRPSGYSHGVEASGRQVYVGGQIGVRPDGALAGADLVSQVGQALRNVLTVLGAAGASPEHVVRMTWYVTDMDTYRANRAALGVAYRSVMGDHYPAMTLVCVSALVEAGTCVEIEATAVIPEDGP